MSGSVVLFVGSPALCELHGGSDLALNWAWGALCAHLTERRANLLVCDGAAGPGDLAIRVARATKVDWRCYCADGWFYSEHKGDGWPRVSRWRHEALPPAGYVDRGSAMVEHLGEQGKTRPVSVLVLGAPWATPMESRPAAALITQAVHAGFEIVELTCPDWGARRVANG